MLQYCDICCVTFEGARCPVCGKKSKRTVEPYDICFLTEKEVLWSGLLEDVLKQRNIPFVTKNVLGAGFALRTGPMRERVRFYVFHTQLSEARDIVDELFSSGGEVSQDDEPTSPDDAEVSYRGGNE